MNVQPIDFLFMAYVLAMLSMVIVAKLILTTALTAHAMRNGTPFRQAVSRSWNEG